MESIDYSFPNCEVRSVIKFLVIYRALCAMYKINNMMSNRNVYKAVDRFGAGRRNT